LKSTRMKTRFPAIGTSAIDSFASCIVISFVGRDAV
jgi:hypothetical protein